MMYTFIVALVVIVLLIAMALVVRRPDSANSVEELISHLHPVNLEAFRNLTSRETDLFLAEQLSRAAAAGARRARAQAAIGYLLRMFHNAGVLIRIGDLGRGSDQADAAAALANHAIYARIRTASEIVRWIVVYAIPAFTPLTTAAAHEYLELRTRLAGYSVFWQPAYASRLTSSM